jgi:GAF domain-containing protein
MPDPDQVRGRLLAVLGQDSSEPLSTRLCRAAPAILDVDGAGVCLIRTSRARLLVAASDGLAERLEQLQLDLGEGPCLQAASTGEQVLVPDTAREPVDAALWMYLHRVAAETPVRAVFSFPIAVGSIAIGALDLYNRQPGPLSQQAAAAAVVVADFLALALLAEQAGMDTAEGELNWLGETPDTKSTVHQATGVLIAQLDIDAEDAFARLRAYAFRESLPLTEVARQILDHELHLER